MTSGMPFVSLTYRITQRDTFEDIIRAREGILRIKSPAAPGSEGEKDMPIVIVGSESSFTSTPLVWRKRRSRISTEEACITDGMGEWQGTTSGE